MADLRIKIELNKGRKGIPLDKLAAITERTMRLLNMVAHDLGFSSPQHAWLAENFENGSVDFDCRFAGTLDEATLRFAQRALCTVFANDYTDPEMSVRIRPETRRQYARVAQPIDPDEVIGFGVYSNGERTPHQWFQLTRKLADVIEEPLQTSRESFGEVQGIVHAFFKETDRPYLKIRELSTQQLVNCYFPPTLYRGAVEVMADPDAVVFVEGWVKEDAESGFATEIEVTDFRLAPEFSAEVYRATLGSLPDYTGSLSTAEFLEGVRHE